MSSSLLDRYRNTRTTASNTPAIVSRPVTAKLAIQLLHDQTAATGGTATHEAQLPNILIAHLRGIGGDNAEALPATLLAAFAVFLSRYTNQHTIELTISESYAGSPALDVDLTDQPLFTTVLQRIHDHLTQVLAQPTRAVAALPLPQDQFSVTFTYRNQPQNRAQASAHSQSQLEGDVRLEIIDSVAGVQAKWIYHSGRFEAATIARMHCSFQTLLFGIIAQPAQPTSRLPLLTATERSQLLAKWNATATSYPKTHSIHALFEAQAARTPHAVALIFGEEQISYRTLNRRANRLARRLHELGVGPDVMVGLCMDRSPDQIVSVLGILKAGGAYVPLDPTNPPDRLGHMLEDTQTPVLLTQRHLLARLSAHTAQILYVDDLTVSEADDFNFDGAATAQNLAYVIYTSGSTGVPKGVLIEHGGLVNHTLAIINSHKLNASDRVLQFSSLSFDAAAATLFSSLIVGATLVLPEAESSKLLGDQLTQLCEQQRITVMQLPASVWHRWVDDLQVRGSLLQVPLKVLLVGGESPSLDKLRTWINLTKRPMIFLNAYGPTEATITATLYQTTCGDAPAPLTSMPMGRALANKQVYILDDQLQPVPIGTPGEIYIGGIGLARGYLNRPELTAERFINWTIPAAQSPSAGDPLSVRLYRTGDLARYRADGNIEFLGRIDHQVKLRGFRVELGEIEATLRQHPAVRDAVVLAQQDPLSIQRLVGYIVVGDQRSEPQESLLAFKLYDELRTFLREKLPDYMIPAAFVALAALPLTSNGKLDRRALPAPANDNHVSVHAAAPRTPEETMLANIWGQVLCHPNIGLHDNFFTFGGHSLLAPHAISLINAAFKRNIPLRVLYEAPTIAAFTRAIRRTTAALAPHARANLAADVTLDSAITAAAATRPPNDAPPKAIFLTGATGFLGAFLLNELLQRTSATIYCLVRATCLQEANQRIELTLAQYQIGHADWHNRIVPVLGDLGKAQLGLNAQSFQFLAATIDAIYHVGAQVHYLHSYDTLKAANVQGTIEILRLACQDHLKPIHYTSTLAVATSDDGSYVHEDDELTECTSTIGYVQSKWVAEGILRLARTRGLQIAIYRPGRVGGHSQTGAANPDDSFTCLLAGCIQLGLAPDIPMQENLMPADYAAQAIVYLSQQPSLRNATLHMLNPQPTSWQWVVGVTQELGYPLRILPYREWYRALAQAVLENRSPVLHSLVILMPQHQAAASWIDEWTNQVFDMRNTVAGLAESDISCPIIDRTLMDRMLAYSARHRLLETSATPSDDPFVKRM